ncbi:MAG: amino acid adenylation domain-containing protein [Acidimicrobiia bacterium]|nr:amino acid adenylation domain-containing protein [Acidimicrobiia bacterium]
MALRGGNSSSSVDDAKTADAAAPDATVVTGGFRVERSQPLSPLQEAMLFHSVATEAADLYVIQQRLEIEGPLRPDVFVAAWEHVIRRHEVLRSAFAWQRMERPVQLIYEDVAVEVDFSDLTDHPDAAAEIEAVFAADRKLRYVLDEPPLIRLVLMRTAPEAHTLLWSQHHLLQDGWSATLVLEEVFAAYDSLAQGHQPDPTPARAFADYIAWLDTRDTEDSRAFWRDHLADFDEPTRMVPAQHEAAERNPAHQTAGLSEELTAQLRSYAEQNGLTLNTVLIGGLAIAVSRYTGRRDVATAFVASGRPPDLEGVEEMVGMFINTLVLRVVVAEDMAVAEWLRYVQDRQAATLEHQHTGLTEIQDAGDLKAGTSVTDTLFAYWAFGGSGTTPTGEVTYRTVSGHGTTSFPFSITVAAADPIAVELEYDAAAVTADYASGFLAHYLRLLQSIAGEDAGSVGDLDMLTEAELDWLEFGAGPNTTVPADSVVELISQRAGAAPDAIALDAGGETMTYGELASRSDQLAGQLIAAGGFTVQRVAIHLPRSIDMVVAMLAAMKSGAAFVPIDRHLPAERIRYLLVDSGADAVVTTEGLSANLPTDGPSVITMSRDDDAFAALDLEIPIGSNDLAYIMYTSGSTGLPKGVAVTHGNLANYIWWAWGEYGASAAVDFALHTSPGFDLTITSLFVPLISGGRIVIYPDDDARDLSVISVFEDDAVDVVKLTPSHLSVLEPEHFHTTRINTLILGGEELRGDAARTIHDASQGTITIYNEYGPTEATVGCMIHRYNPEEDLAPTVPIGVPAANTSIHVLGEGLAPVPLGAVGEIYVGGAGVATGYRNRAELTKESFLDHPGGGTLYRTGDLARWRRDGRLEYLGRADDQVKVRGIRIEPAEIESVLADHPAVKKAAVAVREPHPGDQRLVGYYVPDPTASGSVTDIRDHLEAHLPAYMVTRHLVRIDELPLTANGKLDRDALPDFIGEVATSVAFVAPRNDAEQLVAGLAADLLDVEQVSITDNFFELGGHSILAMRLIAAIDQETGVKISPRVVLLNPLEQAAAVLAAEMGAGAAVAAPSAPDSDRTEVVASNAHFFGPQDEPLFGLHYAPVGGKSRGHAVLLCPPLGWEYMRTHWAMRQIARHLVVAGFDVMRFDFFATGDSSGESGTGSVTRWVEDVASAAAELSTASHAQRLSLVGVRLGATLAAKAVAAGLDVERIVMWDPVLDGGEYLRTLEGMQDHLLDGRRNRRRRSMRGDDLMGFPYPAELRRELEALQLDEGEIEVAATVVASQPRIDYRTLADEHSHVALDLIDDDAAWDDPLSAQSSLLPRRIPRHIASLLGGGP